MPESGFPVLPATFDVAVIRFTLDDAAKAFDVLNRGGQCAIVGEYTYAVSPKHIALLDEAKISYVVESAR
jgi:hypothetical protein